MNRHMKLIMIMLFGIMIAFSGCSSDTVDSSDVIKETSDITDASTQISNDDEVEETIDEELLDENNDVDVGSLI